MAALETVVSPPGGRVGGEERLERSVEEGGGLRNSQSVVSNQHRHTNTATRTDQIAILTVTRETFTGETNNLKQIISI